MMTKKERQTALKRRRAIDTKNKIYPNTTFNFDTYSNI